MPRALTTDEQQALEAMVDGTELHTVVAYLSTICYEKADHLASNWQDMAGHTAWTRAARYLDTVANNAKVRAV